MSLNSITANAFQYEQIQAGQYKGFTALASLNRYGYQFSVLLSLEENSDATFCLESKYQVDNLGQLKDYVKQVINRFPFTAKQLLSLSAKVDLTNDVPGETKPHLYDLILAYLVGLLPAEQQPVVSSILDIKLDAIVNCQEDIDLLELVSIEDELLDEGLSKSQASQAVITLVYGVKALDRDFRCLPVSAYEWGAYGPQ